MVLSYYDRFFLVSSHTPGMFGNVVALVILAVFDVTLSSAKARWFSIHAFANLLVCFTALPAIVATIMDPYGAMSADKYADTSVFGSASPWPILVINSVHVYHMLAFKLSAADYFHHLLFIPTVGFIGQASAWGCLRNFLAFFISGLPGGVDYFNLCLCKHGYMRLITQKRICAALNIWLRAPALLVNGFIMYCSWLYGTGSVPTVRLFIVLSLSVFNGQYYAKQSVANHAITHVFGHVKERISVTTGTKVPDWGKEAKEPQHTMS